MDIDDVQYKSGVVRPMECLREGWQLIKDDYWLFFGITFVAMLIAGMAPLAILFGPMMCGVFMCLLQKERGKQVTFDMVFQGFQFFGPSLLATMVELVPMLILGFGAYILFLVGFFTLMAGAGNQGPPNPEMALVFFGASGIGLLLLISIGIVLESFVLFAFLLIVDKNLAGWDAVRLSFRAVMANLSGILGLVLLSKLLGLLGVLLCGVGAYLEMPISFAMITIAYCQVFPHHDPFARFSDEDDELDEEHMRRLDGPVDTAVKVDPM